MTAIDMMSTKAKIHSFVLGAALLLAAVYGAL